MPTLGKTDAGASSSASSANKTAVSSSTPASSGTVDSATAHLWITSGGTPATAKYCIYADSSGLPGAKLAESDPITVSNTTDSALPFIFSGANRINVTAGTPYHHGPAWQDPGSGGSDSINLGRDNTASARQEASSYAPDPFGTPSAQSGPVAGYVTYLLPSADADGAFFDFF